MDAYEEKARRLFREGYNCTQAVVLSFNDKLGLDEATALRLASSFGGGMGRLREVCGAVSGMFMVLGVLYGYDEPGNFQAKKEHYERVQLLAKRYADENGSIICRELLGLPAGASDPTPDKRTDDYYAKRPCEAKIGAAARLMNEFIKEMETDDTHTCNAEC